MLIALGNPAGGAGGGGPEGLGFLVSARAAKSRKQRVRSKTDKSAAVTSPAPAAEALRMNARQPRLPRLPLTRSSLFRPRPSGSIAPSAGGSRCRKPPHQRPREEQCHPSGCRFGRNARSVMPARQHRAAQCERCSAGRSVRTFAANGAECERLGAPGLSFVGAADEGAGRGQSTGADFARRHNSGIADSERTGDFGSGRSRGSKAVAL